MHAPSTRVARLIGLAAVPIAIVGSGLVVIGSSYSVFSATTANPSNSWSTGSVNLTDDDTGTAMFTATNLKPGSTGTRCIAVTSTGSLPSTVKLYGTSYATTAAFGSYLNLTITQGTGATFASCSGFTPLGTGATVYSGTLAGFSSSTSFGTGVPASAAWAPTGAASETRVFQISYTADSATPNTSQSGSAAIGFTWEAQTS